MRDLRASLVQALTAQSAEGCVKVADDLARYRDVIAAVRPRLLVETGTYTGGSACWFREQGVPVVATVDLHDQVEEHTKERAAKLGGIHFLRGDSAGQAAANQIFEIAGQVEGTIMVVLDSWHGTKHVLAEMLSYGPLVTPGSYLVVEDTIVRWMSWEQVPYGPYDGSPYEAVDVWLDLHSARWEVDLELEDRYPTTLFPHGWLRRL